MNETVTLKSGHVLTLQMASFDEANALKQTVASELMLVDVKLPESSDMAKLMASDASGLKNIFLMLIASKKIEAAIMGCAKRCLLDGVKVEKGLFEEPHMRGDYMPMMWEVMKFNLLPFFAGFDFKSLMPPAPAASSPKSA